MDSGDTFGVFRLRASDRVRGCQGRGAPLNMTGTCGMATGKWYFFYLRFRSFTSAPDMCIRLGRKKLLCIMLAYRSRCLCFCKTIVFCF